MVAREVLENRVTLRPAVPHSEARNILIQGDIFINASLTEAFCIAIVEAASAGLLVVSTRVGGVPEVLPSDMLLLADPTPDSLSKTLDLALIRVRHIDRRLQHKRVAEMYSWWNVAERTEAVYDEIYSSLRDDSLLAKLERQRKGGAIAGILFVFLTMALEWVVRFLDIWKPVSSIEKVPNLHYI